jgi:hypothetical protein
MADWVNCEQERNDKATALIDLLHFLLRSLKSAFFTVFGGSDLSDDAVLCKSSAWVSFHSNVAAGVDVGSVNDEGFTICKALADVEVASITHASTCFLELEDDIFLAPTLLI